VEEKEKTSEGGRSGGSLAKVITTVFAAIIAPVLVAVLVKWLDPTIWKSQPSASTTAPASASVPSAQAVPETTQTPKTTAKAPTAPTAPRVQLIEVRRFREQGHEGSVNAVGISPNGQRVLSGGADRTVRLWDVNGGPPLKVLREPKMEIVRCVAFLPDGRRALTAGGGVIRDDEEEDGSDFQIRLWDLETGNVVRRFQGHTKNVYALALSGDGRSLLTGSDDTTVRLWDVEQGREVWAFRGHSGGVWCVALTPDGQRAMSGDDQGEVRVWNTATRDGTSLPPHRLDVLAVALSPDGRYGLTGAVGRLMRRWDLEKPLQVGQFAHPTGVASLAFLSDGKHVASASGWRIQQGFLIHANADYRIRLFDAGNLQVLAQSQDFPEPQSSVVFSRDGRNLVCGGDTVHLLEIKEEPAASAGTP
jgi:WD40 repeat protein